MLLYLGNYITSLLNPAPIQASLTSAGTCTSPAIEPNRSLSQELKTVIEELNVHPIIGTHMRNSHSFKTAYSAAKSGVMTTYAKFLHNALVYSKSPEHAAAELLMKNGDMPMRTYHEINNALSKQTRQ